MGKTTTAIVSGCPDSSEANQVEQLVSGLAGKESKNCHLSHLRDELSVGMLVDSPIAQPFVAGSADYFSWVDVPIPLRILLRLRLGSASDLGTSLIAILAVSFAVNSCFHLRRKRFEASRFIAPESPQEQLRRCIGSRSEVPRRTLAHHPQNVLYASRKQPTHIKSTREETHETSSQPSLPNPSFSFLLRKGSRSQNPASTTARHPPN